MKVKPILIIIVWDTDEDAAEIAKVEAQDRCWRKEA